MYNGWGSIYWDSSVGDTAAWGLHLQSPPNVGVADQPLVDEFTTNYIVGGEALCLAPNFDNYTSEMGAISGITSPSNGSAEFNGTSDYVQAATAPIGAASAVTITGWFNTTQSSSAGFKGLVSKGSPSGFQDFVIALGNTTKLVFYLETNAGAGANIFTTTNVNDGRWHYFAATWNSATGAYQLYLNGSIEATGSRSGATIKNTQTTLTIGAYSNISNQFAGNLANVAIWNRALSSDEINSVMWKQYEEISTSERNGLQAWYSLDSVDSFDWYTYAQNQGAVIEGRTCVDNALNALAQL